MSDQAGNAQQDRLRSLPVEIQTEILVSLYANTTILCDYGETIAQWKDSNGPITYYLRDGIRDDNAPDDENEEKTGTPIQSHGVPIYEMDNKTITQLENWAKLFTEEARVPWESHVMFAFPSTVAMLDVLLGPSFSPERRSLVKYVDVFAALVPLQGSSKPYPTTHYFTDLLPYFTNMNLNLLIYRDALSLDGDPFGRQTTPTLMQELISSPGWKELIVIAPDPPFSQKEVSDLTDRAYKYRDELNEPEFELTLPTANVVVNATSKKDPALQGNEEDEPGKGTRVNEPVFTTNVPGVVVGGPIIRKEGPQEPIELMTVWRGQDVKHLPPGESQFEIIDTMIKSKSWYELRKEGGNVVDEALNDLTAWL